MPWAGGCLLAGEQLILSQLKSCPSRRTQEDSTEMFGASRVECGNYIELSLDAAKVEAKRYLDALNSREQSFLYNT